MSEKKFCMECGKELILSADGAVAICANCGKSYTFTQSPVPTASAPVQEDVATSYKEKVFALVELGKKEDAIKYADEFLEKHPEDYRSYLLRGALEVDLYRLNPVDAVIDGKWFDFKGKLEEAMKLATVDQLGLIKAECAEYCGQVERTIEIFYGLKELEKNELSSPIAPQEPTLEKVNNLQEEIEALEKKLVSTVAEIEQTTLTDETESIRNLPPPQGLFGKKKELRRREALIVSLQQKKTQRLQELSLIKTQTEQKIVTMKAELEKAKRSFEEETQKYQTEFAKYQKEKEEYETKLKEREEKAREYLVDPIANAIMEKLDGIKAQIDEHEKELARLNKQSKSFSYNAGGNFNSTDYYLAKAAHRAQEQRLTSEKIRITGLISELKFKLLAPKPQTPIFKD